MKWAVMPSTANLGWAGKTWQQKQVFAGHCSTSGQLEQSEACSVPKIMACSAFFPHFPYDFGFSTKHLWIPPFGFNPSPLATPPMILSRTIRFGTVRPSGFEPTFDGNLNPKWTRYPPVRRRCGQPSIDHLTWSWLFHIVSSFCGSTRR